MTADGDIVARGKTRPETLDDFKALAKEADDTIALKAKADGGDGAAKIDFIIRRFELLRMTRAEAKRLLADAPKPTAAQAAALDLFFTNEDVSEIMKGVKNSAKSKIAAGQKLADLRKAGHLPEDRFRSWGYWSFQCDYAESVADAALFEECLKELKVRFKQESLKKNLDELDARLKALRR